MPAGLRVAKEHTVFVGRDRGLVVRIRFQIFDVAGAHTAVHDRIIVDFFLCLEDTVTPVAIPLVKVAAHGLYLIAEELVTAEITHL